MNYMFMPGLTARKAFEYEFHKQTPKALYILDSVLIGCFFSVGVQKSYSQVV